MNFLQFAVWGAYLTSMGSFLVNVGLAENISWFYAVQGIVSIFMPALIGIISDRWIPAQRMLGLCHFLAAVFMGCAAFYGMNGGDTLEFSRLFTYYTLSVAFYMPTLALSNSVAYSALEGAKMDTVVHFPPIRVFGTIGFICAMIAVDFLGYQNTYAQFFVSAGLSLVLAVYAQTLPPCAVSRGTDAENGGKSLTEALGLRAFTLFKEKKMAYFFLFSFLLGVSLQITNGYANPFIQSFAAAEEYKGLFFVEHANLLISLSQMSETLCILLIPFFLHRYGIKNVMLIAMFAWVLRFGFFAVGNPGHGVWLFILSMIVYGVAFDFFNVSGSLFVDKETSPAIRSSAQGLFMIMTNGLGATIGSLCAGGVINHFVNARPVEEQLSGWSTSWLIFSAYALVVGVLFAVLFKYKHERA
ncbi:MAG: MFS transporter [Roseburia sp.]|nr:MFS transporter [Roseburia sp.]MCM1421568.1 MFS transporter [Bacteroides sp.]